MAARPLAWLLLVAVLFVTVSPIDLRPMTGEPPNLERFAAFAALGCVFAFAYPRRWWLVLGLVLAAAFGFELAQLLAPGRHAGLKDALFKAAGGALGVGVGLAVSRLFASGSPGSPAA